MEIYQSEQEQVEALKKRWRENARAVIAGVVIGLGSVFAVWAWRDYHKTSAEQASAEYEQLVSEARRGADKEALEHGARLMSTFSSTPYAVFAALASAKIALDNGDREAARKQLEWALAHAHEPELQQLARLRLARVLLAQDEAQAALKLMSDAEAGGFRADYDAVLGDIYQALKQADRARGAYQQALRALSADGEQAALLRMKLDDLGSVNTPPLSTP